MRNGLRSFPSAAFLATALLLVSGCGASGGSEDAGGTTTSVAVTTTKAAATTTAVTDGTTTTTDAPTTTAESATPGSGDGVCPALKIINGYEAETRGAITRPWSELQPIFVDGTDDVINAYDDAIAAADPTLAADLTTLRDFTAPTADLASSSASLEEFSGKLVGLPGLLEAGAAGQRLDAYSRSTCGFGTSAAGGDLGG